MVIARSCWLGAALALFPGPRRPARAPVFMLALGQLLAAGCSTDRTTEPRTDRQPQRSETSTSGFIRDDFTDVDGTLLHNHIPDGGDQQFSWLQAASWGFPEAVIQDNAVIARLGMDWAYVTSVPTGDWAELTVDVFGDAAASGVAQDIVMWMRTADADLHDGFEVYWSIGPTVNAVSVHGRDLATGIYHFPSATISPGLHTFRAEINTSGAMEVSIDSQLVLTHPLGPLPPPNRTGLGFWTNGNPTVRLTSFSAAHQQHTVKLERDDVQVWPSGLTSRDGASGQFQVQVRVSVTLNGTTVKDKWVKLSLAAVDSSGQGSDGPYGHFHAGLDGAKKPAGTLSKDSVNTGSSGVGVVQYTSSPVSGPVVIRAEVPGARPDSMTIPVGVPGLVPLVPNGTFKIVGVTTIHPRSNWVTPAMEGRAKELADSFFSRFHKEIGFNDASLPFGGRFDLKRQWEKDTHLCVADGGQPNGCHQRHRVGRNIDLQSNAFVSKAETLLVRRVWMTRAKGALRVEGNHFHIFAP